MTTNTRQPSVLPWSPSSLNAFETCPRRYKLTRITKAVREPQTAATLEGNRVHKAMENALKGIEALPPHYAKYNDIINKLRSAPGVKQAERAFALTAAFRPVDYWSRDAWVRGKIDVTVTNDRSALLLDYKTGKPKSDEDQAKVYAGVMFAENPVIETVRTGYVWLGHDRVDSRTFTRGEVPVIWQDFVHRVGRMSYAAEHDDFPPKPSGLCREWCPVGRSLCEHCGKE